MASSGKRLNRVFAHIILTAGAFACLIPFLWMVTTALKDPGEAFLIPPKWIPWPVYWSNFVDTWEALPFGKFLFNSVFVTLSITLGQLICCSLAAYAFARLHFRGKTVIFMIYLSSMMVPAQITMIPLFLLMRALNLYDTYYALILPGLFGSAFGTFLLRQFFLTIPSSLEDAATIDGCGPFQIYWRIILPLSKPALATLGVFVFMGVWNDFMWPLIVISSPEKMTLTVGLAAFQDFYTSYFSFLMCGALISVIPILVIFLFSQKYFVQGITLTGMKE